MWSFGRLGELLNKRAFFEWQPFKLKINNKKNFDKRKGSPNHNDESSVILEAIDFSVNNDNKICLLVLVYSIRNTYLLT